MIEEIKALREDGQYFTFVHDVDCQAVACVDAYLGWYFYQERPYQAIMDIMSDLEMLSMEHKLEVFPAPKEAFEGLDYPLEEEDDEEVYAIGWEDEDEDQEDYQDCFCGTD